MYATLINFAHSKLRDGIFIIVNCCQIISCKLNKISGVENYTPPLVSMSASQCRTRKDIPGTHTTGLVYTSTHRRENPMTAM